MKEATGELNMTVITLVAIAAIGALFYIFVWPMIQRTIASRTCNTYGPDYKAYKWDVAAGTTPNSGAGCVDGDEVSGEDGNGKTSKWLCCKSQP